MSSVRVNRSGPTRLALSALMVVGLVLSVSACRVNGGATLGPVSEENEFGNFITTIFEEGEGGEGGFDQVGGTALLAVSANLEGETFRANGTFRNRGENISFTFNARDAFLDGPLADGVQTFTDAADGPEPGCAGFAGTYKSNNKADPGSGELIGFVFQDEEFTTVVLVFGSFDETPRYYVGETTQGKLKLSGSDCAIGEG